MPGSEEIKIPISDTEFEAPSDFDREKNIAGSDIPNETEPSDAEGKVVDFYTRETISEPVEATKHAEQVKLFEDSIKSLNEGLEQATLKLEKSSAMLKDLEEYIDVARSVVTQKAVNNKLIELGVVLGKLDKELKAIENDKTFWRRRIKQPEKHERIEQQIKQVTDAKIELWRIRKGEDGNTIELDDLVAKKNEMNKSLRAEYGPRISNAVDTTQKLIEETQNKNRRMQQEVLEKKKELQELKRDLVLLQAFNK